MWLKKMTLTKNYLKKKLTIMKTFKKINLFKSFKRKIGSTEYKPL